MSDVEWGGLRIERASHATDEVRLLVGELEDTLAAEYPPEQRHGLSLDAIFQPIAAMRLYARRGFTECAAFGDYASMAPNAIATSVFLEKHVL